MEGDITRHLIVEENGGGEASDEAGGRVSSSASATPIVVLGTFVSVTASLAYGFATGYSSPAESGILNDLNLSIAEYSVFGSMLTIGGILGAAVSGILSDFVGRKATMWLLGICFLSGWLAIIFAQGAWLLDIGRTLLGFGIGIQCFVAPAYIGEIAPKNIRGAFTAANQLMVCCGLSLVYFIGNLVSWRSLAIFGAVPILIEVAGIFFIPESPRWLAKVGREKDLQAILERLRGKNVDISSEAAEIIASMEINQQLPKPRFTDMFQRKYAWLLSIGVGLVLLEIFGGAIGISYYASSIFKAAGCSSSIGTMVMAITNIPFSVLNLLLVDRSGRRPLWMISAAGTCLGNILIGLGFLLQGFGQRGDTVAILVFTGMQVYVASFTAGVSGIPWIVVSEILPLDIRGSAGSLVTLAIWGSSWIVSYTFNFMFEWSPAGVFFVFAGICASTVIFIAKLVPETKGRTLEEIQASVNHRI